MAYINLAPGVDLEETEKLPKQVLELWQNLALTTNQADPFCCSPVWNLAYQKTFYPEQRIFWLQKDNALLLFGEHNRGSADILLTPLENGWFFGQPLLGGLEAVSLLEYAAEVLSRYYSPAKPMFILSGIIENGFAAHYLYQLLSSHYAFFRYQSTTQCAASLTGGLDGWLGRRSANHRAKLRKAIKKVKNHGITFERFIPADRQALTLAYQRILNIEKRSWKGREQCGMTESPSREFYETLLAETGKNVRIIFANLDGQDIGFIFGSIAGKFYRGQQFSYDDNFASFSLGNVMQYEKIVWLCEQGVGRYDMGPITGPKMGYKEHWTELRKEIQTWIMKPRSEI